jgi:hypothetical protein
MTVPVDDRRRPRRPSKAWNLALAIFFFVLGVIGVFIPIMPQLAFFFLSLIFFSRISPRFRRAVRRFRKRRPKLDRAYEKWRAKARRKRLELIRKARRIRHDIGEKVEEATGHSPRH